MKKLLPTLAGVALGLISMPRSAAGQTIPHDYVTYHNGPILSPNIVCLMWSPDDSTGFSDSDVANGQAYLRGITDYFSNWAAPEGTSGAGHESVVRQYGVWGAYFDGRCTVDHQAPTGNGLLNMWDGAADSVIATEISNVFGPGVYGPNTVVLVLTKGLPYSPDQPCGRHWPIGANQFIAVSSDLCGDYRGYVGHELIESATDPNDDGSGWMVDQDPGGLQLCFANGWTHTPGNELCDDGSATRTRFRNPVPDGFDYVSDSIDNIDSNAGNTDNCGQYGGEGAVASTNAFANVTTTLPVTIVPTGSTINVFARTETGILHLVPNRPTLYFTQLPSPGGVVTETPAVFSSDGVSMDMFGRGTDGALYHWTYDGSAWSTPTWLGGYTNGSPAAAYGIVNGTPSAVVLMLATTGQIAAYVNGSWSYIDMPLNVLAVSPPQIFKRSATCLDVYFTATDGRVYTQSCWPSQAWTTVPTTAPAFGLVTEITHRPGGPTVSVFLNQPVWDAGAQPWFANDATSSGLLPSLPVTGPVAAIGLTNGYADLFATSGGAIYESVATNRDDTAFTSWSAYLAMGGMTSPPVAYSADGVTKWVFARGAWGSDPNHLLVWHYDGSSWTGWGTGFSIM